jgi:hypothetical protein
VFDDEMACGDGLVVKGGNKRGDASNKLCIPQ